MHIAPLILEQFHAEGNASKRDSGRSVLMAPSNIIRNVSWISRCIKGVESWGIRRSVIRNKMEHGW